MEAFQDGGVDFVVDEWADHVIALGEDRGFDIEVRFLEVQFIAMRTVGLGERVAVVWAAAEQDHAHEWLRRVRAGAVNVGSRRCIRAGQYIGP